MIRFNKATLDAEMVIGDTGDFCISPKLNNEYALETGDHIWFTLRKLKDKTVLLQKDITEFQDHVATIPIPPSDTQNMDAGTYLYDLKWVRNDSTVDTLLPNGKESAFFVLKKGVK